MLQCSGPRSCTFVSAVAKKSGKSVRANCDFERGGESKSRRKRKGRLIAEEKEDEEGWI